MGESEIDVAKFKAAFLKAWNAYCNIDKKRTALARAQVNLSEALNDSRKAGAALDKARKAENTGTDATKDG